MKNTVLKYNKSCEYVFTKEQGVMIKVVTMSDIAKEAGVSQSTVSRVLSGSSYVNPEIKLRVMECVKKHDYQPNIIAQSLVANKSLLIGAIIPDISNPFFADLIKAIEDEALKYGYSIILCNTYGNLEKEKNYINILKRYKADGIIMVPRNTWDKSFQSLKECKIPIVISTQDIDGFSSISVSHLIAGKDVAKHLINAGYSTFVYVGNPDDDKERGFKNELENSGFDLNTDYTFINLSTNNSMNQKMTALLENNKAKGNLGIFAFNDVTALIVLDTLKENKVKIPDEVALIGFDNTFIGKEVSPSISSVAQPVEEIGKLSIEILLDKILNKQQSNEKHIVLESRIVARESTVKMRIL